MTDRDDFLPWTQSGWRGEVTAWIHEALGRRRIRVTGPIEQPHVRPWSTVLRVPTGEGTVFFKASAPVCAHEPAATLALARWRPDCLPRVLAADIECGWTLLADGGTRLREILRADRDPAHLRRWEALLPTLAELEIALSGRLTHLLAFGTPDRRLATLPAQYEALLADTDALHIGRPEGLRVCKEIGWRWVGRFHGTQSLPQRRD